MKLISKDKLFIILCKVFFIGLLLQFFAYTFATFKLGFNGMFADAFWLWKEIFVVIASLFATYYIWKNKVWQRKDAMRYITLIFIGLMIYGLVDTLLKGLGVSWFIKARKYDFIGYMIFIATYYLSQWNLSHEKAQKFLDWTMKVVQWLLVLALLWYIILLLKPGVLKLFGYDRLSIEGSVGQRPPAVYWTREFEGLPRNQFVFERPISRGFFLTAIFPLFFVYFLQRKSLKKTWFWWAVFGLNVIATYSRAAWGSWIIELGVLGIITYRKQMKYFFKKLLLPALIVLVGVAWIAKDHVINREFSNTGHVQLLAKGFHYFSDNWLFGMGAGSVGPASHWEGGLNFNPENQYLQIAIEFGIIGFIIWMTIYIWLHYIGYDTLRKNWKLKKLPQEYRYLIAFSIGMMGLSISGLVLHSFTDRMIVYPFMLIGGIIYFMSQHPTIVEQQPQKSLPKKKQQKRK